MYVSEYVYVYVLYVRICNVSEYVYIYVLYVYLMYQSMCIYMYCMYMLCNVSEHAYMYSPGSTTFVESIFSDMCFCR